MSVSELHPQVLFDLKHTLADVLLENREYPWEALPELSAFILEIGRWLPSGEYDHPAQGVWIARNAKVAPSAYIEGPCIIGSGAQIRHCAFIRGSVLVGNDAVVGNSTELKNCILFDCVQVPHFNYIGDSILGYFSHMGAGAVTSNVKSDRTPVTVCTPEGRIETGLRKLGAILADHVEIGCQSVLNPGTVIGRNSSVYPLSSVRGYLPPDSIYKDAGHIVKKEAKLPAISL